MEFIHEKGRIYANDAKGKLVAEITFPEKKKGTAEIDHTFVDQSLRGQGIAEQLIRAAIADIKKDGKEISATCSYAVKWLQDNKV